MVRFLSNVNRGGTPLALEVTERTEFTTEKRENGGETEKTNCPLRR
jgi:hypothetical protein